MPGERESRNTENSGTLSAMILMAIIVLIGAYSMAYGLQTLVWIQAQRWATLNPWLNDVPMPLPGKVATAPLRPPPPGKVAPPKATQLRAYDYEFTVPWTGQSRATPLQIGTEFRFTSGQVVVFFDPETQLDTLRALKSSAPAEYQKFQRVFREQPIESNYALYQAIYGATPAQASPFLSSDAAQRINVLLLWKLSFGFDQPGIYSFDFGRNRGFQFGNPAGARPVAVRVFDGQDRQFRFFFTVAAASNAQITQDAILTVVQSLQMIPILER
ncbi:MAG: hypothetical protein LAN59_06045 [Acidobacteriia bacterium]|nr:hypothetical protein [Terriglobia bacterium]